MNTAATNMINAGIFTAVAAGNAYDAVNEASQGAGLRTAEAVFSLDDRLGLLRIVVLAQIEDRDVGAPAQHLVVVDVGLPGLTLTAVADHLVVR